MLNENRQAPSSSKRDENSLYTLTKKFLELLNNSPDKHINMKTAADILKVGKRRIYDVTNVLDGLGMVSKWSVNSVKWTGQNIEECLSLGDENKLLENAFHVSGKEEGYLDEEIKRLNKEISVMSQDKTNLENAYVTYADLLKLNIFKNNMVFALKAPSETTVEYPRYVKGLFNLRVITENGHISLFYISKDK